MSSDFNLIKYSYSIVSRLCLSKVPLCMSYINEPDRVNLDPHDPEHSGILEQLLFFSNVGPALPVSTTSSRMEGWITEPAEPKSAAGRYSARGDVYPGSISAATNNGTINCYSIYHHEMIDNLTVQKVWNQSHALLGRSRFGFMMTQSSMNDRLWKYRKHICYAYSEDVLYAV